MSELERALEDCLVRLQRREATLEECLAGYPEYAETLRPMLLVASRLERGRTLSPNPTFKSQTRAQLIAHTNRHQRRRPARGGFLLSYLQFNFGFGRIFNLAVSLAIVMLLFLMTGTALAQTARPGDTLYSWRIASEQVWRVVHPDPLAANLTLTARHARDLVSVAGNPQAEPVARRDYQQSLDNLSSYAAPDSRQIISEALAAQKSSLQQAQLSVPELDQLLRIISNREATLTLTSQVAPTEKNATLTYQLTVTNMGPASPATAIVTNILSPVETLVSAEGAACTASEDGTVTCTVDDLMTGEPQSLTLTTSVNPCYSGMVTNTATVTGTNQTTNLNSENLIIAESSVEAPVAGDARVVFVQSNGRSHSLGLVTPTGQSLNFWLHPRAAAPVWSPDGQQLAFFGEEGISELGGVYGSGNGVWLADVVNGQTENPRQLIALDHVKSLAWSPDGLKLAIEVGPPGSHREIIVIDAIDGRELSHFSGEQPAWHGDSQHLIIKGCLPGCGLWQVNLDGSGGKQLTGGETDSYPAWSPTGEYLLFSSERDGNWEVYRLRLADGQILRLTNRAGTDTTPVFGPCGQSIYLRTDYQGSWWVTVMNLDGSNEQKVIEGIGSSEDWGLARPAVH